MKKDRTWIDIDATTFNHNISQYKKVIGNKKLAIVIKANAYGHGFFQIAQLANENNNVWMMCVASASEALSLRQLGIHKPILVFSDIDIDPSLVIKHHIECTIYNQSIAYQLNQIGKKYRKPISVHVKIDTGLSRFGIDSEKALSFITEISQLPFLTLSGVYSHLIESQKGDQSFTHKQVAQFAKVIEKIQKNNLSIPSIHLANSAATTSLDLSFCNLFRIGAGTYGLWPSMDNKCITQERYPNFSITPIATWKTRILSIKKIKAGQFVGYDRTFQASHDMQIATIPIGYYDGYDFNLYNKGLVIVRDTYAAIVGRISMNICTIDITNIDAQEGDTVILMGPYQKIQPADLCTLAGNPNVREITTKINATIVRNIIYNNSSHVFDQLIKKKRKKYVHPRR